MNIDIVLLNGPSSSGKSSIAMDLQKKLNAKGFDSIINSYKFEDFANSVLKE